MDDDVKGVGDYLSIAWRRKFYLVIPVILISAATLIIVNLLPPIYRSTGTILVESQQIPQEFIQSTVTGFADERITIIRQRIMTSRQLLSIIEKFKLYENGTENAAKSDILNSMRSRILVDRISANVQGRGGGASALIAFNVGFEHSSASVAQRVANELVTLFLEENAKTRREKATDTTEFLNREAVRLRTEIEEFEEQIASFRQENEGQLPENMMVSIGRVEQLRLRLFDVARERQDLINNRTLLQIELDNMEQDVVEPSEVSSQSRAETELIRLQNEFVSLSSRYGTEHPDVRALRREINAYEERYGRPENDTRLLQQIEDVEAELVEARQRYTEEHPDIRRMTRRLESLREILGESSGETTEAIPPERRQNPSYLQAIARLDSLTMRIQSLDKNEIDINSEIIQLENKISQIPQVQRGLDALRRDYENTRIKYQDIRAKQLQAELSISLEEEQKGERFTLLEPPLLPDRPVKPDKKKLTALGLMLSVFCGIGLVVVIEALDGGIYGSRALAKITKMTPLVSIPYLATQQDVKRRRLSLKVAFSVMLLSGIAALILVHYFYKPIDILWLKLIQKLSLV